MGVDPGVFASGSPTVSIAPVREVSVRRLYWSEGLAMRDVAFDGRLSMLSNVLLLDRDRLNPRTDSIVIYRRRGHVLEARDTTTGEPIFWAIEKGPECTT